MGWAMLLVASATLQTSMMATTTLTNATTIDDSSACQNTRFGTAIEAIDSTGNQAGVYYDCNKLTHAFLRTSSGTITEIVPTETGGTNLWVMPIGFDGSNNLVGAYQTADKVVHGWVRSSSGTITVISVTGAIGTTPTYVDSNGDIAGVYQASSTTSPQAFKLLKGGSLVTFNPCPSCTIKINSAGLANYKKSAGVAFVSVNSSGVTLGTYVDNDSVAHGFVGTAENAITTIDYTSAVGTGLYMLSESNYGYGTWVDSTGISHGLQYKPDGSLASFDAGCTATGKGQGTIPVTLPLLRLDSSNDVAGVCIDSASLSHGFVRLASGTVNLFDVPGAATVSARIRKTAAQYMAKSAARRNAQRSETSSGISISDIVARRLKVASLASGVSVLRANKESSDSSSSAHGGTFGLNFDGSGNLTGVYSDADGVLHGFLRTATGAISTIDMTGAGTGTAQGTVAMASLNAATVAGIYWDSNSASHGFVGQLSTTATTTTLTASPSTAVFGQPVTLTASVAAGSAAPSDGESVYLYANGALLDAATLTSGQSAYTTTSLPLGTYSLTASYGGDAAYQGSATTTAATVTVGQATTTTALTTSSATPASGETVTLTATVTGEYGGTASGQVTFASNGTTLGTATLSGNVATYSTTLADGIDSLTATYAGDTNFTGSTSSAVKETVGAAATIPTLSVLSPAYVTAGASAFTLTVTGTGFYSGSVIYWGSSALTTTFVSSTSLTATVPASDVTSSNTVAITVANTASSNEMKFQIDPASTSSTGGVTITTTTVTVTAGTTASYPVTVPSTVSSVSASCLNLPTGATCSYSSTTGALSIVTSASTPAGTYTITTVFTETVTAASTASILLPFLLVPLFLLRRKLTAGGMWMSTALIAVLWLGTFTLSGCGGSSTSATKNTTTTTTKSATVTLVVK
jgi:hypothetical protein